MNTTTQIAPPTPGVHSHDPSRPITAPRGSVAFKHVDLSGKVICYCWVAPEIATPQTLLSAWAFWDEAVHATPFVEPEAPAVRLLP